eukprot:gb/GECG01000446.1/.p1 GENE.gb/GECG01000446.1/~~gb/GECG01000446.1/.p1  ORF type:complete len:524 (+),score=78.84 gb/GECG01000446.1/:1-1572(+)
MSVSSSPSGVGGKPAETEDSSSWRTRLERTVDERREQLKYQRSLTGKINALNEQLEKWELQEEANKDVSSENKNEINLLLHSKKKKNHKPSQDESVTRQLRMEREQEASSQTRNALSTIRKALSTTDEPWKSLQEKWRNNPWLWPDPDPAATDVIPVVSPKYRRWARRNQGKTEEEKEEERLREEYEYIQALLGKGQAYFDAKTKAPKRRYSFGRFITRPTNQQQLKRKDYRRRPRANSIAYSPKRYPENLSAIRLYHCRLATMSLHELMQFCRAAEITDELDEGRLPREMPLEKSPVGTTHRDLFVMKMVRRSTQQIKERGAEVDALDNRVNRIMTSLKKAAEKKARPVQLMTAPAHAFPRYTSSGLPSEYDGNDVRSGFGPGLSVRDDVAGDENECIPEATDRERTMADRGQVYSDAFADTTSYRPMRHKAQSLSPSSFRLNVAELERAHQEEQHPHSARSHRSMERDKLPSHIDLGTVRASSRRALETTGELAPWEVTARSIHQRRVSQEMFDFTLNTED